MLALATPAGHINAQPVIAGMLEVKIKQPEIGVKGGSAKQAPLPGPLAERRRALSLVVAADS